MFDSRQNNNTKILGVTNSAINRSKKLRKIEDRNSTIVMTSPVYKVYFRKYVQRNYKSKKKKITE